MEFDTFSLLQISLVVLVEMPFFKHIFSRTTHPPCTSCEHLAEFVWWKILYFIFRKPIKLTSAVGVRLMGQYEVMNMYTNINLTTDMGSD